MIGQKDNRCFSIFELKHIQEKNCYYNCFCTNSQFLGDNCCYFKKIADLIREKHFCIDFLSVNLFNTDKKFSFKIPNCFIRIV